jgi:hypothetical protein
MRKPVAASNASPFRRNFLSGSASIVVATTLPASTLPASTEQASTPMPRVPGTQIRSTHWWRRGASHAFALLAGIVLSMAFAPRATQFINPLPAAPVPVATSAFHRALQTVMVQMAAAMCIAPSADADRDFARAMIPHHQGAVEMAKLELLYGSDPRLRRLAQGMVVEQSQEIALMRSILADASPALGMNPNP